MNESKDSEVELSSTGGLLIEFRVIDTVKKLSGAAAKRHFIRVELIPDDVPALD